MDTIVTRFPPSPTGYLHIGGARTALFNWLYARKTNGKFVLRIEDTDKVRSTKESVDAIFESLEWLGIDWDEGPFFQTRRYDIYKEYIEKLVKSGHAYYCSCSQEEVNTMREEAKALGKKPMYNNRCRELALKKTDNMVVRLKTPIMGATVVDDAVKGSISFQNSEIDDFIIQRSDNSPTYNLAVVVDDLTMGINTILRGDDHLVNTPKQILLYKAFGAKLPVFGHVPMVLGSDKTRLSKRHGAMSVSEYRDMGYLPDAMLNYLVRLGWSFGDQEFFTREDLIEKFTMDNLGKSPSMFDIEKLNALNSKHIQSKDPAEIAGALLPFLELKGIKVENNESLQLAVTTLQPRSKTLVEMAESALFYFQEEIEFDEKAAKKFLKPAGIEPLTKSADYIEALEIFTEKTLEDAFKKVMEEAELKFGKIAQPVRVALTGTSVSPGIFEMILALGQKKTVERIRRAVAKIQDQTVNR
ncbi:MAG: glutamate--tRNA ligase [Thermodesulfobacteriota bacterium]|nr:glutamate--tRNA ligase [Thermodesulfobacteriota bacterium]